ncbi:MAG: septum formation initiator family protein [Bacteroidaceae bacterium]|nr:septum formation initiator family protein [Bacteroidaceae bacterium]
MSRLYSFLDFLGKYKNWIVVLFGILYVGFLDSNSLWERHYRWESIRALKSEISELEANYEEDTRKLEKLRTNPAEVERVAREVYYMTRPGEDLFIIQSDMTQPKGQVTDGEPTDEDPIV